MKFFGTRPTYQIFAGATFITGCIYYLFNVFYIRKRAVNDDNSVCKKKSLPVDIEGNETSKNSDKAIPSIDVARMTDVKQESLHSSVDKTKEVDLNRTKLVSDNADGGSDSGVDNPTYTDTETVDSKKEASKVNV